MKSVVYVRVDLLYFVLCVRDNKRTHSRAAAEADAISGTAAEADAVGEQQLKRTQSRRSSV